LHWRTRVGDVVDLSIGDERPRGAPSLDDLVVGAGFVRHPRGHAIARALSLPDTVGPGMRVLVCGLNPSIYAAERGVGFARPGNRFWKAALLAGLVTKERDPLHALRVDRIGMTDLCKRATVASSELAPREYVDGAARVERLVRWMRPQVVAFVGLEGWRAAVDRSAVAGLQPSRFGGRPAYVLPSTSGLNAHARLDDIVDHLRAVADVAAITPS
jgi:double-stranded uracil-DNA glycosylase